MFEDNSYEPLAEIYVTLSDPPTVDDIYCLCSRVFVDGQSGIEEETGQILAVEEDLDEKGVQSADSEITVRFSSSYDHPQPPQTTKKSQEEAVSCYCSASHYSTDEHDSLRDVSTLHHSDSGADLSESSRDLEWERYWTINGERLIWESWISKYGSYIDPTYLSSNQKEGVQEPAEGDETSFCVETEKVPDPNRKTSFSGLLENIRSGVDKSEPELDYHKGCVDEKTGETSTPHIVVEGTKSNSRRLSDISDTGKSISARSEESSNCDENERLRLTYSRCSSSSVVLSATTDSMTNVTRITLSSSESSCNVDNSSGKSSSVLSSSDSANSVDNQWQNLWVEHFNQQYFYHFTEFTERLVRKKDVEDVKTDSGLVDDGKVLCEPQRQESVDEVGSIETQDSISQDSDHFKTAPAEVGCKSTCNSEKLTPSSRQMVMSVGYLLQQLNSMSVEPSEQIQEEESANSLPRPSTMKSVKATANESGALEDKKSNVNESVVVSDVDQETERVKLENCEADQSVSDQLEQQCVSEQLDQQCVSEQICDSEIELRTNPHLDTAMKASSDEGSEACTRHGVKRSHAEEGNESSVDKIKSAYQLMGLMYDMESTSKIRKASVWYKKRFSQIRLQNRVLRLQKPRQNKHIYFDDDEEICDESTQSKNEMEDGFQDKNSSGELFLDASEDTVPTLKDESLKHRKLEIEDFSEKDDSSDDDQDVFFSAEEDNLLETNHVWRESRLKALTKRRKKRQIKKKFSVNYPEEMISNPKIKKFWRRRYSLFSKFDEGIKMDAESWYSVTPEKIAINIAERCQCDLVVDAFCGAGGNAIQLAFTCERVIAIDIDPHKIELARHNARVYGVEDRIEFVVGDFLQLAPTLSADVVFLSPPWGGPEYNKTSVFPLAALLPVSGQQLYSISTEITENVAFFLPKNVNTQELVECAGPGGCVEVVQNFLDRELVAVTAYFGELVNTVE